MADRAIEYTTRTLSRRVSLARASGSRMFSSKMVRSKNPEKEGAIESAREYEYSVLKALLAIDVPFGRYVIN